MSYMDNFDDFESARDAAYKIVSDEIYNMRIVDEFDEMYRKTLMKTLYEIEFLETDDDAIELCYAYSDDSKRLYNEAETIVNDESAEYNRCMAIGEAFAFAASVLRNKFF